MADAQLPPMTPAPGQAAGPSAKAPLTPEGQAAHDLIMDFITRPPVTDQGYHYASDEERKKIIDEAVKNMKTKWRRRGNSWHYGPPRPLMTWFGVKVVYLCGGLILLTLALALQARVVSLVLHDWLLHGVKQRVPKMWEKLGRPEYCLKWWQMEGLLTGGAKARWAQVRVWQSPEVARDRRWRWQPPDLVRLRLLRWAGLIMDSTTLVIGLLVIGCAVVHLFR